ncbi:retention module-containing protein, partial [Pseudaeromonas pectinilytica]
MRTQTLQAPMQVVQMTGDVLVVLANGATRPLLPGEVLPAGTTLQLADDATLQLAPPDGGAPADAANAAPSGDAVPQPAATGVGAEVAAIQQALLEGVDPTLTLEATAAGGAPAAGGGGAGGSGNGGFVSIDRTGDSTLATAGFDTTYQAGATTDVLNPVAATVVDVPAPVITPDGSSVSESNLSTSNELDTDLVDGTQAGQGSTTVQGNLNVDFGGATGSVSFLPVETQPALTSGGQPLVWVVSDDGLTLTGSVNGTVIVTVTLAADGSSYTVDLDGALDNGADPLAIAIGIQAQNDAGAITSGQIVLTVADDAPLAQDDVLSVGEDDTTTVTGNVLVNDQVGADGAVVTAQTVTNELGSLVLGTDGQYSFTLNSSNPSVQALTEGETLTQVYSYTLTDADGDTSTANLTITITGSDDGIVITDLTPSTQGGEGVVFEDDLANGSDASKESLSVEGTFSVSAPDGLQSITIGGVVVTLAQLQDAAANPVALSSALGNSLTITGFSDGVVSYTYTLLGNEAHPAAGNDVLLDNTSILVTDRDGDTASSNLSIQIVDDVPTAVADSASIAEDAELLTIEGNVLTSDTQGADGAVVTPQTVESALGTLELESNGEYSFTLNNSNPSVQALTEGETLTQVYSYTLTDADGDTSTANLTITITGSDDIPTIEAHGEGLGGSETGLPDGSGIAADAQASGSFSIGDSDGLDDIKSLTIAGTTLNVVAGQTVAALVGSVVDTPYGQLTLDSFDVDTGTFSYSYQLLRNVDNDDPTLINANTDGFTETISLSVSDGTNSADTSFGVYIADDTVNAVDDGPFTVTEDAEFPLNTISG